MSRTISIMIVSILIISSLGVVAVPDNEKPSSEKIDMIICSEPEISESKQCTSISVLEANTYLKNPGQPILPVITKTYKFPLGTVISSVNCEPVNIQEKTVEKQIGFAPRPMPRSTSIKTSMKTSKDLSVYSSADLYPNRWYDYNIHVGLDGKEHVTYLTVQFYPIRYSPQNNIIKYATDADLSINFEIPDNSVTFSDEYDMVIIAPLIFKHKLRRLVTHKENMGIKTKIVTTNEIYRNFEGRDDPEKIKFFIRRAMEEWGISYVLLFGGMRGQNIFSWYVPVRYSHLDDASNFETSYISDLYYADIYKYDNETGYSFDYWDSDGNGVFAEWNNDSKDVLDLDPDVYLGRLPCRYSFEVKKIVDRIIHYETTTNGKSWFNEMAVIGGDGFDDISWNTSTDIIEGHNTTEHAISFMDGFNHTRIWVENGDVNLTTDNISNVLNQGQGFVYFTGHGNPSSWSTHPHGDFNTWIGFGNKNIKKLRNDDKLPVLLVGGCHNSQFDTSLLKIFNQRALMWGEATPKCWGWLYTSVPKGGSIATIGYTGLGYGTLGDAPDPPDEIPDGVADGIPDCIQYLGGWIETHFFKVYNHDGKNILGETHAQTIHDYLEQFPIYWGMNWEDNEQYSTLVDVKTVQGWVLFGDPSLKIGGYE